MLNMQKKLVVKIAQLKNDFIKVLVFFFEEDKLPVTYSFDDEIPVRISEGKCVIDFKKIAGAL